MQKYIIKVFESVLGAFLGGVSDSLGSVQRWMLFILAVTGTGTSGQVQDHQGHHRDNQEELQDHFKDGFTRF